MAKKERVVTGKECWEKRQKLGMNQQQFWSRVGVTQSGGSRYESSRAIPRPTQVLLLLAYLTTEAQAATHLAILRGAVETTEAA